MKRAHSSPHNLLQQECGQPVISLGEHCGWFFIWMLFSYLLVKKRTNKQHRRSFEKKGKSYTPNANMADHSVGARDELHESEASEASVFCFENASPEKSCRVDGLVCFISLCLQVFEFLNATRRE